MAVKKKANGNVSIARPAIGCVSAVFALFCSLFVIMAVGELLDGSYKKLGVTVAMLVLFSVATAGGSWVALKMFKKPKANTATRESMVLQLAADNGAKLTVSQLAMRSPLGLDEAREALDEMVLKRAAEVLVDENGAEIYHFVELTGHKQLTS